MRIISGKYKRKNLVTLPGTDITRPTSDRVKENIFNILQDAMLDKCVFDLYAGSGALGLESLSRGAKKVIFVEENKGAIECIKINLKSVSPEKDSYKIIQAKVSDFLKPNKNTAHDKADIIFADPPYHSDWYLTALIEIENSSLCNPECMVILEMPLHIEIPVIENWNCIDTRKYGKTKIEIWSLHIEKN